MTAELIFLLPANLRAGIRLRLPWMRRDRHSAINYQQGHTEAPTELSGAGPRKIVIILKEDKRMGEALLLCTAGRYKSSQWPNTDN